MSERTKSHLEVLGDRLLTVVRDHADDDVPTLRLISDIAWAMGFDVAVWLEKLSTDDDAARSAGEDGR